MSWHEGALRGSVHRELLASVQNAYALEES